MKWDNTHFLQMHIYTVYQIAFDIKYHIQLIIQCTTEK